MHNSIRAAVLAQFSSPKAKCPFGLQVGSETHDNLLHLFRIGVFYAWEGKTIELLSKTSDSLRSVNRLFW